MNKILVLSILYFLPVIAFSEQVKNVKSVFDGNKVTITYDLTEDKTGTTFDVNVKCFDFYDNEVAMYSKTGDIGSGIKAGAKKQIVWKIQNDYRKINSELYFVVEAIVHEPYELSPPQNGNYPEMVLINGGTFQMGSNDGDSDEKPLHSVTVSDFYIGKYEVTNEEFCAFLNNQFVLKDRLTEIINLDDEFNAENLTEKCRIKMIDSLFFVQSGYENYPVINVTIYGVIEYCNWLSNQNGLDCFYYFDDEQIFCDFNKNGYRLPSEIEWEYVAGNGEKHTKYSWGNSYPEGKNGGNVSDISLRSKILSWGCFSEYFDGFEVDAPVGSFNPNEFGIFDMTGNVWEMCNTKNCLDFVLKGGGWFYGPEYCTVSRSGEKYYNFDGNNIGFRVVKMKK
ncbi:MAG: SUMF1/EgtB/PvdO family nonheme iron enzyme [Paludibacteraceae bacterium]|nr:SUMF1/EgtB/PvdO family nonheme iron enzyme [Paludibacteraceae bacterium]